VDRQTSQPGEKKINKNNKKKRRSPTDRRVGHHPPGNLATAHSDIGQNMINRETQQLGASLKPRVYPTNNQNNVECRLSIGGYRSTVVPAYGTEKIKKKAKNNLNRKNKKKKKKKKRKKQTRAREQKKRNKKKKSKEELKVPIARGVSRESTKGWKVWRVRRF